MEDHVMNMLSEEIGYYERNLNLLATKMGNLTGSECYLGYCHFNPNVDDVEEMLDDLRRRQRAVKNALALVDQY
jgi:hypothetical protein